MPNFFDLLKQAQDKTDQDKILAQPSVMDEANVDPEGTARIAQAKANEQGMQMGMGSAMGTIQTPKLRVLQQLAEAPEMAAAQVPEMGLAEKIKQAAMNSKVKGPEGGLTNNASMYQKGTKWQADNADRLFGRLKDSLGKK